MLKIHIDPVEVQAAVKTHFVAKYPAFAAQQDLMFAKVTITNNTISGAEIVIADSEEQLAELMNPAQTQPVAVKRTRRSRAEIDAEEAAKKAAAAPKVTVQAPVVEEEQTPSVADEIMGAMDASVCEEDDFLV